MQFCMINPLKVGPDGEPESTPANGSEGDPAQATMSMSTSRNGHCRVSLSKVQLSSEKFNVLRSLPSGAHLRTSYNGWRTKTETCRTLPYRSAPAMPGEVSHRGVWRESYKGPNDETILYAQQADGKLACARIFIPKDTDEETFWEMAQGLKRTLDAADPITSSSIRVVPPVFVAVRRPRRHTRLCLKLGRDSAP